MMLRSIQPCFVRRIVAIAFAALLISCFAFPSPAHAKKMKGKIRDFVKTVSGVTIVEGMTVGLVEGMFKSIGEGIAESFEGGWFMYPLNLTGQAAHEARKDHVEYMTRTAKAMDMTYPGDINIRIGNCNKPDFDNTLSPPCLTNLYEISTTNDISFKINQIKAASDGMNLFVYFRFSRTYDEMKNIAGTPIGIGMLSLEEDDSHLTLFCKDCADFIPTYTDNNIFSYDTRIRINQNECLIIAPFAANDISSGKAISLAGIIETFPLNQYGIRNAMLTPSPFVRVIYE